MNNFFLTSGNLEWQAGLDLKKECLTLAVDKF